MSYYSEIVYWKYNYLERRINKNEKKEKVMVVSPHFDDAILSCGGMLCSDEWFDSEISVINVFTEISQKKQKMSDVIAEYVSEDLAISKSKVNLDMCERWIATRRKEELFATKTLGIKSFDLGYKDAIFRMVNDKFIYDTEEKLFLGQVRENVLLEQLVHQFIDICKITLYVTFRLELETILII